MRYLVGGRQVPVERPTVRVLMQRDAVGAPDGITKTHYAAGQEYDLPPDLAECFFSTGHADPAEAHTQPAEASQDGTGAAAGSDGAPDGTKKLRAARRAKIGAPGGV